MKKSTLILSMLVAGSGIAFAQAPVNDDCTGAIGLNASLGLAIGVVTTTGPYDNDNATVGATDPATGFACWGEPDGGGANPTIDNSLWFTFTGDGNAYFIETGNCGGGLPNPIDDGDTQIAIYSGTCGSLTDEACNEDGPSATGTYYPAGLNFQTTLGTIYYMMIDGFNFNGAISNGQFCINISRIASVACGSAQINFGIGAVSDTIVCFNDTLFATITGVVAPTSTGAGIYAGFSWLVSTAVISGSNDPLNDLSFVGGSGIAASGQDIILPNTGAIFPAGIYYLTPVVYGNAVDNIALPNPPVSVFHLILDTACTYTGTSIMVNLLAQGDPLCVVGINESNASFGISYLYPVPVKDVLNFNIQSKEAKSVEVIITDVVGKNVYTEMKNVSFGENKVSVSMKQQTAGVYFITVKNGSAISVEKFVKE